VGATAVRPTLARQLNAKTERTATVPNRLIASFSLLSDDRVVAGRQQHANSDTGCCAHSDTPMRQRPPSSCTNRRPGRKGLGRRTRVSPLRGNAEAMSFFRTGWTWARGALTGSHTGALPRHSHSRSGDSPSPGLVRPVGRYRLVFCPPETRRVATNRCQDSGSESLCLAVRQPYLPYKSPGALCQAPSGLAPIFLEEVFKDLETNTNC